MAIFHLAFPCHDFKAAKKFYCQQLGFGLGRESKHAFIINCYNNQLVAHKSDSALELQDGIYPRHFGMIFDSLDEFNVLLGLIKKNHIKFHIEPKIRFPKLALEHHSFFLKDPSNNLLEFKYYKNQSAIFGEQNFNDVGEK